MREDEENYNIDKWILKIVLQAANSIFWKIVYRPDSTFTSSWTVYPHIYPYY